MIIRLHDAQETLLAAAAGRRNRSLLPPPPEVTLRGKALTRTLGVLLRRDLVQEAPVACAEAAWRNADGVMYGLVLTAAGKAAARAGATRSPGTPPAGELPPAEGRAAAGRPEGDGVAPEPAAPAGMPCPDEAAVMPAVVPTVRLTVTPTVARKRSRRTGPAPRDGIAPAADGAAPGGKMGLLLQAVARQEGATLDELAGATRWLGHTTRAALTRLRQRGFDIRSEKIDGRRVYRLHGAA